MQTLQNILYKVRLQQVVGSTATTVSSIAIDSRKVEKDSVFVAINGVQSNGHLFLSLIHI